MAKKNAYIFILILGIALLLTLPAQAQSRQGITVNGCAGVASCSSYCDEYEDISFTPDQAFNGNPDRPWMAGKTFNPKEGEWLKFTFKSPTPLLAIRISPGFGTTNKRFYEYPRLKKFQVVIERAVGGGTKTDVHDYIRRLDGAPYKDMVLIFSNQPSVKSFKIQIEEVYAGKSKNYALIGGIEPVVVRNGSIVCSSSALADSLAFLRSTGSAGSAFSFVPSDKPVMIKKIIRHANPMDKKEQINKARSYTRAQLKADWNTWADLCRRIYSDYEFRTYEAVNYFWANKAAGIIYLDMFGPEYSDVMNSYQFALSRRTVTETIKKKDESGKETTQTVKVLKTIVNKIFMISDVYTP